MHSIFAYLESLHPLTQLALLAAFFTSLGISLREVVSFLIHMYRQWRERRKEAFSQNQQTSAAGLTVGGSLDY
jgi:hypothetical protein